MSIPFHVTQQPQAFVRVSIAARGYRSDLVLPGSLPLVDIMPAISSRLLDQGPGAATQGAVLSASDGRILHGGQSLFSQGVKDGDILTLAPRAVETEKRYDDVVEAVADSVEEKNRPWTPANSATMAVAGAVALILTTLVILLRSQDQAPIIVPAVAGVMTLLLLGTVWALQRSERSWHSWTMGMVATLSAFVAGLTIPIEPARMSIVFAGLAMALVAAALYPLLKVARELVVIPTIVGGVLAMVGLIDVGFDLDPAKIWVVVLGLCTVGLAFLPRLATYSSGLKAPPDTTPVPSQAAQLYGRGRRASMGMSIATGIVIVLAIIFSIELGSWAIVAGGLAVAMFALSTRRYYAATDVAIHYACTLVALVAYALAIVAHYPGSWLGISIGAIVFVALMIGGGLVLRTKPTWMARMADWVEMLGGVAIIPVVVMSLELW